MVMVSAKEGALSKDFQGYARRQRELRGKWEEAKKKLSVPKQGSLSEVRLLSYAAALTVAGFKDILDLILIGSLPGIGTIITICVGILILMTLVIAKHATSRSRTAFFMRAGLILMFGTAVEGFGFGLNFLPLEVGMVFGIYLGEKTGLGSGSLTKVISAGKPS